MWIWTIAEIDPHTAQTQAAYAADAGIHAVIRANDERNAPPQADAFGRVIPADKLNSWPAYARVYAEGP